MKSRGINDLYLPKALAYHVKILIGGLFITMFFNVIWKGTPIGPDFLLLFGLVVLQLEIFMVIAFKIFTPAKKVSNTNYKQAIIVKLLKFYLLVLIIALVLLFMVVLIGSFLGNQPIEQMLDHFLLVELRPFLISWSIGITLGSLAFFYLEWTFALKREQKLREEQLIFKYETLKNQVNPHFLFNSLNTLSSLVAKDAALSEKYIQKFSTIYRYILENNDVEMVNLNKEIAFVQDYFYLQEIRDDGKIKLNIDLEEPEKYLILPISIQLLVENALKHNSASVEKPLTVTISLQNETEIVVENNLQKKSTMEPSSKTGLKNLKERIALVMGKELVVNEDRDTFQVVLPVKKIVE